MLGTNQSSANKFKELAAEKLSGNYEVRELKGVQPAVRIVGLSEEYSEERFTYLLRSQNPHIFSSDSQCKLLKITPTKKNNHVYQADLQLDELTFQKITDIGRLIVSLDNCTVYEALSFPRCFNCNGFNHTVKFCKKAVSCPLCSGNHTVKDCRAPKEQRKCINCVQIKNRQNLDIPTDHAAWDYNNCFSYKQLVDKIRYDIFNQNK